MSVWGYKDIFFKNVVCTDNSRFDMAGVLPGARENMPVMHCILYFSGKSYRSDDRGTAQSEVCF